MEDKPRRGRPPLDEKKKSRIVGVRFTPEEHYRLERLADKDESHPATVAHKATMQYLDRRGA